MFLSLYIWMNALDLQQFGSIKSSDEGDLIYYSQNANVGYVYCKELRWNKVKANESLFFHMTSV